MTHGASQGGIISIINISNSLAKCYLVPEGHWLSRNCAVAYEDGAGWVKEGCKPSVSLNLQLRAKFKKKMFEYIFSPDLLPLAIVSNANVPRSSEWFSQSAWPMTKWEHGSLRKFPGYLFPGWINQSFSMSISTIDTWGPHFCKHLLTQSKQKAPWTINMVG